MRKFITFFLLSFLFYLQEISGKICSGHGFEKEQKCICGSLWKGPDCETENKIEEFSESNYNESNFYDWTEISIQKRIEKLYNILPDSNHNVSDPMFPENDSSFNVDNLSVKWKSLKKPDSNSTLWDDSKKLEIGESIQGSLRNCYMFAVLASLIDINGEKFIRAAIPFADQEKSIYVTRWFLFGRYIYVSVNDNVPTLNGSIYGAQVPKSGFFWAAILEKAWAKIWGSYNAITDTTEELFVSALTGSPLRKSIRIFEIFGNISNKTYNGVDKYSAVNQMKNYENQIFLGKTRPYIDFLISNHFFSLLKVYDLIYSNFSKPLSYWGGYHSSNFDKAISFFQLYNPWGIDVPNNIFPIKTAEKLNQTDILRQLNQTKQDIEQNDGKFLIISEDIVNYFERFTVYDPLNDYEIISQQLSLNRDIETDFVINLKLKNINEDDKIYFQFNLLNIDFIEYQIQHFKIKNIKFEPEPEYFTPYLKNLNYSSNYTDCKVQSTYIGGYFGIKNTNGGGSFTSRNSFGWDFPRKIEYMNNYYKNYILNFKIEKYNYDIFDKVFLTFNVPKESFSSINVMKIGKEKPINICINNCSSHGECNISSKTCICESNYSGKACSLTLNSDLNGAKENISFNQSGSVLLSSGKWKCLPGYELIEGQCEECEDSLDEDYSNSTNITSQVSTRNLRRIRRKNNSNSNSKKSTASCESEELRKQFRKTCMSGTCFIPATQTSCQINGCFGRGLCTPKGIVLIALLASQEIFVKNWSWKIQNQLHKLIEFFFLKNNRKQNFFEK